MDRDGRERLLIPPFVYFVYITRSKTGTEKMGLEKFFPSIWPAQQISTPRLAGAKKQLLQISWLVYCVYDPERSCKPD